MDRIIIAVVLAVGLALPGVVHAQDENSGEDGEPSVKEMRAAKKTDDESGVTVHRPNGWVFGKPGKGVIALLTAAGDSQSQIEVRVSKHVKKQLTKPFFASFHSNIQKSGFVKVETRDNTQYGQKKGSEVEYETGEGDKAFRLVVWQYHRAETAYLVVGFFPKKARDIQYKDFQSVCEKLELN